MVFERKKKNYPEETKGLIMLMSPYQERVERLCFKIIPLPLTDLGNRAAEDLLDYNVFRRVMNAELYSA